MGSLKSKFGKIQKSIFMDWRGGPQSKISCPYYLKNCGLEAPDRLTNEQTNKQTEKTCGYPYRKIHNSQIVTRTIFFHRGANTLILRKYTKLSS